MSAKKKILETRGMMVALIALFYMDVQVGMQFTSKLTELAM